MLRITTGDKRKNKGLGESILPPRAANPGSVLKASVLFGPEAGHLYKGQLDYSLKFFYFLW